MRSVWFENLVVDAMILTNVDQCTWECCICTEIVVIGTQVSVKGIRSKVSVGKAYEPRLLRPNSRKLLATAGLLPKEKIFMPRVYVSTGGYPLPPAKLGRASCALPVGLNDVTSLLNTFPMKKSPLDGW